MWKGLLQVCSSFVLLHAGTNSLAKLSICFIMKIFFVAFFLPYLKFWCSLWEESCSSSSKNDEFSPLVVHNLVQLDQVI